MMVSECIAQSRRNRPMFTLARQVFHPTGRGGGRGVVAAAARPIGPRGWHPPQPRCPTDMRGRACRGQNFLSPLALSARPIRAYRAMIAGSHVSPQNRNLGRLLRGGGK